MKKGGETGGRACRTQVGVAEDEVVDGKTIWEWGIVRVFAGRGRLKKR